MFAVPGWSVSASSLVQEKLHPKNSNGGPHSTSNNNQSRKRKRTTNDVHEQVKEDTTENTQEIQQSRPLSNNESHGSISKRKLKNGGHEHDAINATGVQNSVQSISKQHNNASSARKTSGTRNLKDKTTQRILRQDETSQQFLRVTPLASKQTATPSPLPITNLTPLQAKMRNKLTSARFRHLNETLYTTTSSDAMNMFTSSPDLFTDYHAGFAQQVKESWPQNPVDEYVKSLKTRGGLSAPKSGVLPLPRRKTESCTIADLGCGDAPLARGCQAVTRNLKLKFHNYDLHAANSLVTKADISNVPLRDGEADIAIFCLSLMGTNWVNFVEEAWRILRGDGKGEVWVAEVKSRFGRVMKGRVVDNSVGKRRKNQNPRKANDEDVYDEPEQFVEDNQETDNSADETDISGFIKVFTRRGFQLREDSVNKRNKMFVSMTFNKSGIPTAGKYKGLKWTGKEYQKQHDGKMRSFGGQKGDEEISPEQEAKVLKPCVYKTR